VTIANTIGMAFFVVLAPFTSVRLTYSVKSELPFYGPWCRRYTAGKQQSKSNFNRQTTNAKRCECPCHVRL